MYASCGSKSSWENALKCTIDMRERSKRPRMSDGNQLADDVLEHPDLSVHFLSFLLVLKILSLIPFLFLAFFHWLDNVRNIILAFICIRNSIVLLLQQLKKTYFTCIDIYQKHYTCKISKIRLLLQFLRYDYHLFFYCVLFYLLLYVW